MLRKYWPTDGSAIISRFSDRDIVSIRNKVKALKIKRVGYEYTKKEDDIILKYYASEGKNIVSHLPGRTAESFYRRAAILGVSRDGIEGFTEEECQRIRELYPQGCDRCCNSFPNHSYRAVYKKAKELGLVKEAAPQWTEEEVEVLRAYWPIEGSKCAERFPAREVSAVQQKAVKLGLRMTEEFCPKGIYNRTSWTQEEIDVVKEWYVTEGSAVSQRLPDRSVNSCKYMAHKLGVKYNSELMKEARVKTSPIESVYRERKVDSLRPGDKLDMLKLIRRFSERTSYGDDIWECQCDCGKAVKRAAWDC